MGKTELIVRRFVVCYTKLVAGWFVGAHTMEKGQQAALVLPTKGGHKEYKMSLKHFKKCPLNVIQTFSETLLKRFITFLQRF